MNHVSPVASCIVKPGAAPTSLEPVTVHVPAAGPSPARGPRTASSIDTGRARIRLVNQLESDTSSIVLTLPARTPVAGSPGRPKRFTARSTNRSIVHSWAGEASCVSGSRVSGSSSWNLMVAAEGVTLAMATAPQSSARARYTGGVVFRTRMAAQCACRARRARTGGHPARAPRGSL